MTISDQPGTKKPPASPNRATTIDGGIRGRILGVKKIGTRAGMIAFTVVGAVFAGIIYGITLSGAHSPGGDAGHAAGIQPQILASGAPVLDGIPGANGPADHRKPQPARPFGAERDVNSAPVLPINPPQHEYNQTAQVNSSTPAMQNAAPSAALAPALSAVAAHQPTARELLAAAAAQEKIAEEAAARKYAEAARQAPIIVQTNVMTPTNTGTASSEANAAPGTHTLGVGSLIPAVLVTGITSDIAGMVIAQVTEDVFDSATGHILLIPAGARLVGRFDTQVAQGQQRVLVKWQQILYAHGKTMDIGNLTGADVAGNSGLSGSVNDHSSKLYRAAFLSSLIGIGAALAQPQVAVVTAVGAVVKPNVGAIAAGQAASNLAQTADQANRVNPAPPTISVPAGTLFSVMVDHDLIFPDHYVP